MHGELSLHRHPANHTEIRAVLWIQTRHRQPRPGAASRDQPGLSFNECKMKTPERVPSSPSKPRKPAGVLLSRIPRKHSCQDGAWQGGWAARRDSASPCQPHGCSAASGFSPTALGDKRTSEPLPCLYGRDRGVTRHSHLQISALPGGTHKVQHGATPGCDTRPGAAPLAPSPAAGRGFASPGS